MCQQLWFWIDIEWKKGNYNQEELQWVGDFGVMVKCYMQFKMENVLEYYVVFVCVSEMW